MPTPAWPDEKTELLKTRWAEGVSASAIAKELGGDISRSAVLGKVFRLGLTARQKRTHNVVAFRRKPTRESDGRKRNGRRRNFFPKVPEFEVDDSLQTPLIDDLPIPEDQRRSILELTTETCRWPIGDPSAPDFYFCGGQAVHGYPYCQHHVRFAYRMEPPPSQRLEAAE